MKKMISMLLVLVMALSLAACGTASNTETTAPETTTPAAQSAPETTEAAKPETITIQALNANKEMADIEVPYDPQRIATMQQILLRLPQ